MTRLVCTLLICVQYIIVEWRLAGRDFVYEYRHMQIGSAAHYAEGSQIQSALLSGPSNLFSSFRPYWNLLVADMGHLAVVLIGVGWVCLWRRSRLLMFLLLPYTAIQLFVLFSWTNWAARYVLHLWPLLVVVMTGPIAEIQRVQFHLARMAKSGPKPEICQSPQSRFGATEIGQVNQRRWLTVLLTTVLLLLLFFFPIRHSRAGLAGFMLPDVRELAGQWAIDHLPNETRLIQDAYTPDFAAGSLTFDTQQVYPYVLGAMTPEQLKQAGFDYVFTTFSPELSLGMGNNIPLERYDAFVEVYQEVAVFAPQSGQSRGVRPIRVYKLQ